MRTSSTLPPESSVIVLPFTQLDRLTLRTIGRPVSHLTPRYLVDRCRLWVHQRRSPNAPWLTADAIAILSSALRRTDNGLEFGSGASTVWLAKRTNHLISIESSYAWYKRVSDDIRSQGLTNVAYKYIPANPKLQEDPYLSPYLQAAQEMAPGSLDYALIDGWYRHECAHRAVDLLKPGGILILDNANWCVPHSTRSPFSIKGPPTASWAKLLSRVADWRLIWTSNGAWDTALWFKAT